MTRIKKFDNGKGGWVVIVIDTESLEVTQIHSTGLVTTGKDDSADIPRYIDDLGNALAGNFLHSQQPGFRGVRWPE
jgi:hypothetical protein